MKYMVGVFFFLFFLLWGFGAYAAITQEAPKVGARLPTSESSAHIGWIENVVITLPGADGKERTIALEAKVDTGAKTSSLHASAIKIVNKNGQELARFTFAWETEKYEIEAPLQDEKCVKSSEGEERQFIEVEACIGKRKERILISLNDRGGSLCQATGVGKPSCPPTRAYSWLYKGTRVRYGVA